jgi:hypothetical protein
MNYHTNSTSTFVSVNNTTQKKKKRKEKKSISNLRQSIQDGLTAEK